jgi:signal transduction histidine kinase/ligand-binding sensor domain-containing protein/DNA-binding response OmpR family regulator
MVYEVTSQTSSLKNDFKNMKKNVLKSHPSSPFLTCCLALMLIIVNNSKAQYQDLVFRHINSTNGLSQSYGVAITKDHKGFMWFGTQDGLNKYDGYNIIVYKFSPSDSGSISNNFINKIYCDKQNNLWIGTKNGLNLYDRVKDRFIRFVNNPLDPHSIAIGSVDDIYEDSRGNLWIGTQNGLHLMDRRTKIFVSYQHNENQAHGLANNHVTVLYEDRGGNFWVGTFDGGLNLFDRDKKVFKSYLHDPSRGNSLSNNHITSIVEDHQKNLWVATDAGVNLMDREQGTFKCYVHDPKDEKSLGNNVTYFLLEDKNKNLWVGTMNGGLNLFHRKQGTFTRYMHDPINKNSISNITASAIYEDDNGTIWVGVHRGGINYFNVNKEKFKTFQQGVGSNSLSNNNVTSLIEDREEKIWIGTDGGGLNVYDRATNSFSHFKHNLKDKTALGHNVVLSLLEDKDKNLWIGLLSKGLNRFDRTTKKFVSYKFKKRDGSNSADYDVWSLLQDDKNILWIGTSQGLWYLDKESNTIVPYTLKQKNLDNDIVQTIFQDSQKGIWLGFFNNGVYKLDPASNTVIPFHPDGGPESIRSERINTIAEDDQGNIYIGGYNGLYQYNLNSKRFKSYKQKNGLPTDVVKSILTDARGDIWVCSLGGISKFDADNETFRTYTEEDGLQSNEFTQNSCLRARDGELYVGGINGFNSFYPDSIKDNDAVPPIVFTDFKVFNKSVLPDQQSILQKHISESDQVTLRYDQSVFTFEFAALNFLLKEKNQYAYKLEGFDDQWNFIGNQRSVTYTNLDPGEYIFRVKACNNDGIWNEAGAGIKVMITPPFWLTWWFKLLAGIVIGASFIGFYRVRIHRVQQHRKELEQQVLERTKQLALSTADAERSRQEAEQANKAKSVFLATMSHEIRTPMNGVIGMASLLAETELNEEQKEYTHTIRNCGESLLGVINDVLDYSKIESGKMELEQKDFDLRGCIEDVLDLFAGKASEIGLDLIYKIDYNVPLQIVGDSLRLRQVLTNLVGNAIKFTRQGEIFVGVSLVSQKDNYTQLRFDVRDTGIGIPADKLDRLFKAFSQVDSSTTRKYGGTGLGLVICEKIVNLMGGSVSVESKEAEGTKFTFTLSTQVSEEPILNYVHMNLAGLKGKRVLVVDDNATNRLILENQLEQWMLSPTMAVSADEALQVLALDAAFDLLITDMQMPKMDGVQLAQKVKISYPNLPLILLSSVGDERGKFHSNLFSSVLTKPVKHATLHKHIINQFIGPNKRLPEELKSKKKLHDDFAKQYPLQILIAEDNPVNQKLAERVLAKLGYKVDIAGDGIAALHATASKKYHIIFMDVQMPEMDGLEATRTIRQQNDYQPVIIAMTANAMQGDREICLQSGMNDYISKPINLENLISLIEKWAQQLEKLNDAS